MALRKGMRSFFILYSNGDTFYFTVNPNLDIYCNKFITAYESNGKKMMPAAQVLNLKGDSFDLQNYQGETIYSLEDYRNATRHNPQEEIPTIERLYIDADVRMALLESGRITYDAKASQIPGLLSEPLANEHTLVRKKCQF